MKYLWIAVLGFFLSQPVWAERKYTQGEYEVHYSAFNASFLAPETAQTHELIRSKQLGVITLSLRKAGLPRPALINGVLKNLAGEEMPLSFQLIKEGNSLYYLSQFPITQQDVLTFSLSVQPLDSDPMSVQFTQEVFPEP